MKRKEFLRLAGAAATGSLFAPGPAVRDAWAGAAGKTRVTVKLFELKLRQAWGLSRGTWTTRRNCYVRIERDGVVGLGEAAPIARYNETAESAAAFIDKAGPVLEKDLGDYAVRFGEVDAAGPGEHAAKAALDMAVLDWVGRRLKVPLWRLLGLGREKTVTTTYSIGIDEVPVMQQKVRDAGDFGVYKIKVGTSDDRKIIEGIRAVTSKPLRTDANEGWKTKEEALEMINWMAGLGVELIEQPRPASRLEDYAWLKDRVKIPVFADESLILPSDLPRIAPYFHGV
ncbi:MAG: dipeptide epimerase, partial [Candidatus Aminicenantes bacterium]|nr:dipeptide epimerase [Candidatus Aminicenantes bacterium]